MLGEGLGEKNVFFTLLDVFLAYKTRPSKILLAWASWPNSDSLRQVLGKFFSNIFYCFYAKVISHTLDVILKIMMIKRC